MQLLPDIIVWSMEQDRIFLQKWNWLPLSPTLLVFLRCVWQNLRRSYGISSHKKTECVSLQYNWTEFIVISFIILVLGDIRLGYLVLPTSLYLYLLPSYSENSVPAVFFVVFLK
jgi:hypothetical protein